MEKTTEALIDEALGSDPGKRREAFLALLRSNEWRTVLASHVLPLQVTKSNDRPQPDQWTFREAAKIIARDEERVQHTLELAGGSCSDILLHALALEMKSAFVEPALSHLRTAEGSRRVQLLRALHDADPMWVRAPGASHIIRRLLRDDADERSDMMQRLARASVLGDYIEEVRRNPPTNLDEWSALGRSGVHDEELFNLAMASLPQMPIPMAYLLRLNPLPAVVLARIMASARGDWVVAGLETAVVDGLRMPTVIPLVELGVRLGGRSMSFAVAWITSSKMAVDLLKMLAARLTRTTGRQLVETLRTEHRLAVGDRALEAGRDGQVPDPMDAAALVRQIRGRKTRSLVREILSEPLPTLMDAVLRPLCAVNTEAAREVIALCKSSDDAVVARAQQALAWPDVPWPLEDAT